MNLCCGLPQVQMSCGLPKVQVCCLASQLQFSYTAVQSCGSTCKRVAAYRSCTFVTSRRELMLMHTVSANVLRPTASASLLLGIAVAILLHCTAKLREHVQKSCGIPQLQTCEKTSRTLVAEDRIGTIVDAMHRFNTAAARVGQRRKRRLMSTSSSTAEAHAPGCTPGELPCHGPSLCRSRRSTHGAGLRRRI
jgi:hypothetical protein